MIDNCSASLLNETVQKTESSGLMFAFLAFFCPAEAKCVVRQMYALPFGASRAVYGYLRRAYSLWWLAVKNLKLMMTHFLRRLRQHL